MENIIKIEDPIIRGILLYLNEELKIKTVACCKGKLMEPLTKAFMNPFILFYHSEQSLNKFIQIMVNMGISKKNLNYFLKSTFDTKTGELRWVFTVTKEYYNFDTNKDFDSFWLKFEESMKRVR